MVVPIGQVEISNPLALLTFSLLLGTIPLCRPKIIPIRRDISMWISFCLWSQVQSVLSARKRRNSYCCSLSIARCWTSKLAKYDFFCKKWNNFINLWDIVHILHHFEAKWFTSTHTKSQLDRQNNTRDMPYEYAKIVRSATYWHTSADLDPRSKLGIVDIQAHVGQSLHDENYKTCPITLPLPLLFSK